MANGNVLNSVIKEFKISPSVGGFAVQTNPSTQIIEESAVTDVELSYVHGVTSSIQTQLNIKNSGGEYVNQDTDYTVTLPAKSYYALDFTVDLKVFNLPDMKDAQAPKNPIILDNISADKTVILKDGAGSILYSQILPGQKIVVCPTDWSSVGGSWNIVNLHIQPADDGGIPYAIPGGSYTYKTSPNMKFDGDSFSLNSVTGTFKTNRGTTTQRLALTPTEGDQYYDLTLHQQFLYNGSAWVILG